MSDPVVEKTSKKYNINQLKSKIKQILLEILQKTDDFIVVSQILCGSKQMKMLLNICIIHLFPVSATNTMISS